MADTKISALPASTTPLAGTEVLPIVQSGNTKKVSVDNLTQGKYVPTNGITFPAVSVASADPNILDDYEEGTFTPAFGGISGGAISYTTQTGRYTKIGRQVTAWFQITVNTNTHTTGNANISSLPFAASASGYAGNIGRNTTLKTDLNHVGFYLADATPFLYDRLGAVLSAAQITNGCTLTATVTYFTA